MPSTMPLRVGDELLSSARVAAEASGRSAAQQIGYWAKLGRELERSGSISMREIALVLEGARAYDELDPKAQALVRAEWAERIEQRLATLDLGAELAQEGRSWVELGPDGAVIRHPAEPPPKAAPAPRPRSNRRKPAATSSSSGKKATTRETAVKKAAKQPAVQVAKKKVPAPRKKATARTR